MAQYKLKLKEGNNLVSIPLDMTPSSTGYEDDPKVLFNPQLMSQDGKSKLFRRVLYFGQAIFNMDGVWEGNYNQILPQHAFWINVANNTEITVNGDTTNPVTIEYTIDCVTLTLKITEADGTITEIVIPIGTFTF